jgi:NTP pyrophosphatase (non-canonical NTP hydrolase)
MVELKQLQDRIWANKVSKDFNTTNVEKEFNYTYAELAEAFEAYRKQTGTEGEELADVIIFTLSLAKMLGVDDLEGEIMRKLEKNEQRQYRKVGEHNLKTEGDSNE